MTAHRRRIHGMDSAIEWSWLPVSHMEHQPQVYDVILPHSTK